MRKVLLLVISLTALAGCGIKGDLVRPVPLWGDPPNEGPNDPRPLKAEEERRAAADPSSAERARPHAASERQTCP